MQCNTGTLTLVSIKVIHTYRQCKINSLLPCYNLFFFPNEVGTGKGGNVVIIHNTSFKNAHLVSSLNQDSLKQVIFLRLTWNGIKIHSFCIV